MAIKGAIDETDKSGTDAEVADRVWKAFGTALVTYFKDNAEVSVVVAPGHDDGGRRCGDGRGNRHRHDHVTTVATCRALPRIRRSAR